MTLLSISEKIQKHSEKFLKLYYQKKNALSLFVPAGFAHAYYSIEKENIIYYKLDNYYSPKFEDGITYNDKYLKIKWPKSKIITSKKDKNLLSFREFKKKYKAL